MMLGGPDEAPPMIVAQNQMIVWEVEYYQEESFKFLLGCVAAIIILIPPYIYLYGG